MSTHRFLSGTWTHSSTNSSPRIHFAYIENDPYLHGFGEKNSDGPPYSNGIANASMTGFSQYLNLIRAGWHVPRVPRPLKSVVLRLLAHRTFRLPRLRKPLQQAHATQRSRQSGPPLSVVNTSVAILLTLPTPFCPSRYAYFKSLDPLFYYKNFIFTLE